MTESEQAIVEALTQVRAAKQLMRDARRSLLAAGCTAAKHADLDAITALDALSRAEAKLLAEARRDHRDQTTPRPEHPEHHMPARARTWLMVHGFPSDPAMALGGLCGSGLLGLKGFGPATVKDVLLFAVANRIDFVSAHPACKPGWYCECAEERKRLLRGGNTS